MNDETYKKIVNWLLIGKRGLSSECIVSVLVFGKNRNTMNRPDFPYHPSDPADLNRCRMLLNEIPELQESFKGEMPKASREWSGLVKNWELLMSTLEYEMSISDKYAPKTYSLMQEILKKEERVNP